MTVAHAQHKSNTRTTNPRIPFWGTAAVSPKAAANAAAGSRGYGDALAIVTLSDPAPAAAMASAAEPESGTVIGTGLIRPTS